MSAIDRVLLLAAAGVPTVLLFVFKAYFQHLLDQGLQSNLEKLKSELAEHTETVRAILELELSWRRALANKRMEIYPGVVGLATRLRNLARNACADLPNASSLVASEFSGRLLELDDLLTGMRFYLNADGTTLVVHKFNDCASKFYVLLGDIVCYRSTGDEEGARALHEKALKTRDQMDDLLNRLNRKIQTVMSSSGKLEVKLPMAGN